jgi:hypothetical protein
MPRVLRGSLLSQRPPPVAPNAWPLMQRILRLAVRANDITLLMIKRSVPKVRLLPTMQAKLTERPDLKP